MRYKGNLPVQWQTAHCDLMAPPHHLASRPHRTPTALHMPVKTFTLWLSSFHMAGAAGVVAAPAVRALDVKATKPPGQPGKTRGLHPTGPRHQASTIAAINVTSVLFVVSRHHPGCRLCNFGLHRPPVPAPVHCGRLSPQHSRLRP
jgi:hypothetical protein